jgi:predicted NBD/HSP70 family sugar kinase
VAAKLGVRLSGTNLERAADYNQRIVLHAIRVHGRMTRVEISTLTGLTSPAIANITKRLLDENLIEAVGRLQHRRGQPATEFSVNRDACFSMGLNIDRDHLTIVLVNFMGETLAKRTLEIAYPNPKDVQNFYRQNVPVLIEESGVKRSQIVGLGVAIPDNLGHVDLPGRPENYGEWDNLDLSELLSDPIDLPIFVENDAAAAAMGEQQLGAGRHYKSMFYILISRGLGGGLVIDGNYVRGEHGRSGEIGFLRHVDTQSGLKEPVQSMVSVSGLENFLRKNGVTPHALYLDGHDDRLNALISEWVDIAADWLASPLAAINCLINPAAILLSGRLPSRILDQMALKLSAVSRQNETDLAAPAVIARASLSEDAPAVGAAILPFSHFLLPKPGALWK